MAQPRDQLRHLHPRQLPALTGLGTLGDLDLQLLAMVEIFRRHAKAPRGHLLDLGARVVAIRLGGEMRRVLAALAAVAARADPVHRHVERLVRLGRQRTKAHPRRDEPLADRGDAFHFFQRDCLAHRLDRHQVAQMNGRLGLHRRRILLPQRIARLVAGRLHHVHGLRAPGMGFTRFARLVEAADRQDILTVPEGAGMHFLDLGLNPRDANPRNPARQARKIFRAKRAAQPDRLEIEAAAIGGDNRDAHLRHDLEKPQVNRRAIARHRFGQAAVDQPARDAVGQRVLGQVGVDRGCTRADQHGEIMRVDAFGRAHVEAAKGPQPLARQVAVHRARGEDHRHPDARLAQAVIAQHQIAHARAHGILGLGANPFQPVLQRRAAGCEGAVDLGYIASELPEQLVPLRVAHKRAFERDDLGLRAALVEHVLEVAEPRLEAHDPKLAQ